MKDGIGSLSILPELRVTLLPCFPPRLLRPYASLAQLQGVGSPFPLPQVPRRPATSLAVTSAKELDEDSPAVKDSLHRYQSDMEAWQLPEIQRVGSPNTDASRLSEFTLSANGVFGGIIKSLYALKDEDEETIFRGLRRLKDMEEKITMAKHSIEQSFDDVKGLLEKATGISDQYEGIALSDGEVKGGFVEAGSYRYYRVVLNEPVASLRLVHNAVHGMTALYVSNTPNCPYPTREHSVWMLGRCVSCETITISPSHPRFTQTGTYFIAIFGLTAGDYTIQANPLTILKDGYKKEGMVCGGSYRFYKFSPLDNASNIRVELHRSSGNASLYMAANVPMPPTKELYTWKSSSEGSNANDDVVNVKGHDRDWGFKAATYLLSVHGSVDTQYTIMAVTISDLKYGQVYRGSVAEGHYRYYAFTVADARQPVRVDIRTMNGHPDTFISPNHRYPSRDNHTWKLEGCAGRGAASLVIAPDDPSFKVGEFGVGVYGRMRTDFALQIKIDPTLTGSAAVGFQGVLPIDLEVQHKMDMLRSDPNHRALFHKRIEDERRQHYEYLAAVAHGRNFLDENAQASNILKRDMSAKKFEEAQQHRLQVLDAKRRLDETQDLLRTKLLQIHLMGPEQKKRQTRQKMWLLVVPFASRTNILVSSMAVRRQEREWLRGKDKAARMVQRWWRRCHNYRAFHRHLRALRVLFKALRGYILTWRIMRKRRACTTIRAFLEYQSTESAVLHSLRIFNSHVRRAQRYVRGYIWITQARLEVLRRQWLKVEGELLLSELTSSADDASQQQLALGDTASSLGGGASGDEGGSGSTSRNSSSGSMLRKKAAKSKRKFKHRKSEKPSGSLPNALQVDIDPLRVSSEIRDTILWNALRDIRHRYWNTFLCRPLSSGSPLVHPSQPHHHNRTRFGVTFDTRPDSLGSRTPHQPRSGAQRDQPPSASQSGRDVLRKKIVPGKFQLLGAERNPTAQAVHALPLDMVVARRRSLQRTNSAILTLSTAVARQGGRLQPALLVSPPLNMDITLGPPSASSPGSLGRVRAMLPRPSLSPSPDSTSPGGKGALYSSGSALSPIQRVSGNVPGEEWAARSPHGAGTGGTAAHGEEVLELDELGEALARQQGGYAQEGHVDGCGSGSGSYGDSGAAQWDADEDGSPHAKQRGRRWRWFGKWAPVLPIMRSALELTELIQYARTISTKAASASPTPVPASPALSASPSPLPSPAPLSATSAGKLTLSPDRAGRLGAGARSTPPPSSQPLAGRASGGKASSVSPQPRLSPQPRPPAAAAGSASPQPAVGQPQRNKR